MNKCYLDLFSISKRYFNGVLCEVVSIDVCDLMLGNHEQILYWFVFYE
jgi:hypothetical protein